MEPREGRRSTGPPKLSASVLVNSAGVADGAAAGAIEAPLLPKSVRRRSERCGHDRLWLVHRALLVADVAGLSLAFSLAQLLFKPSTTPYMVSPSEEVLVFAATLPLWVLMAKVSGLYGRDGERADHSTVDECVAVGAVITVGVWLLYVVISLTHDIHPTAERLIAFWLMAIACVLAARAVARAVVRRHSLFWQNTVIVGAGDVGQLVARKLQQHPEYGLRVVGFVDRDPKELRSDLDCGNFLGSLGELPELIEEFDIDRVIVAYSSDSHEHLVELIHKLRAMSIQVDLVPRLFEVVGTRVDTHSIEAFPLIGLPPASLSPSARLVKRGIDVVVASSILLLVSPLFAWIAWKIKRGSPGPVFFGQTRVGFRMNDFKMLKFRSMYVDANDSAHREYVKRSLSWREPLGEGGVYKPDMGSMVTPFGRFLRRTSLDEVPQLINVVKGEMSLVGPRPCLRYETEYFASHHFERFLVPCGLTGLWQVAARSNSSFGEALDMDVAYARSWSLGLDLRLLFKTPLAVVRQTTATT